MKYFQEKAVQVSLILFLKIDGRPAITAKSGRIASNEPSSERPLFIYLFIYLFVYLFAFNHDSLNRICFILPIRFLGINAGFLRFSVLKEFFRHLWE